MKTKITGSKGSESNNAAIRRKQSAPFLAGAKGEKPPPPHAPQTISDEAMILARQVTHLGLAALGGGEMSEAHALRGLMAATLTVSSAAMDRPDVVIWLRSLSDELEAEERAEYGAQVRAAMRRNA